EKNIDSIVAAAYRARVPVFSPAIVDSAYGIALVTGLKKKKRVVLDMVKDFHQLVEIGRGPGKISAIYVGGGVPKDYVNLMTVALTLIAELEEGKLDYYKGFEYIVQFTTDMPQWGGLSGATLEEAVSWGKVSPVAKKRTVHVDATIALPLIAHGLLAGNVKRANPRDASWILKRDIA
ncbi:MAG: deoxyhypusine synthase family protein, partial [Desulfurococcaceae archaeon]